MIDLSIDAETGGFPFDKKEFEYCCQVLEEEGFDEDVAEAAVKDALESHLDEDGIDDYEMFYDDAKWVAERMQEEKDRKSQN